MNITQAKPAPGRCRNGRGARDRHPLMNAVGSDHTCHSRSPSSRPSSSAPTRCRRPTPTAWARRTSSAREHPEGALLRALRGPDRDAHGCSHPPRRRGSERSGPGAVQGTARRGNRRLRADAGSLPGSWTTRRTATSTCTTGGSRAARSGAARITERPRFVYEGRLRHGGGVLTAIGSEPMLTLTDNASNDRQGDLQPDPGCRRPADHERERRPALVRGRACRRRRAGRRGGRAGRRDHLPRRGRVAAARRQGPRRRGRPERRSAVRAHPQG